ncbi:MAG: AraC family transcriptional regulator [Rhodothermaceae bacterium]|nr:AraC family transcriptional regulator [Rhodothermaceae bacterium]
MSLETNFDLAQLVTLFGALLALLLSIASLFWSRENRPENKLFASIMVLFALLMLGAIRSNAGIPTENQQYWVLHLWGAFALAIGPLLYFYVRTSVDASYIFKGQRLVHFIPILLHLSLLMPLVFVGAEIRESYVNIYIERELYRKLIPGIPNGMVLMITYALASFIWIRRFKTHVTQVASFEDQLRIRWLRWFTSLLVMLLLLLGLFSLHELYRLPAACAMTAFMCAIILIALVRPRVFHGIQTTLKLSGEEKYGTSQLDTLQKKAYLKTLLLHFEQEKPYLQQELTLRDVAAQVNMPYRHVSQVVNEMLDKHFIDFVNSYRIEAAKTILLDPNSLHLSIEGVAAEAGFNSRSAFYREFKKATGVTPGAFRKSQPTP